MSKAALARYETLLRRFGNVQSFISNLQKADKLEPWNRDVLGCILIRLRTNFAHLAKAHERPYDPEYIAWAARNLLELAIWSVYATTSKENAKRLHSDQMVDLAEMVKTMLGLWGKYAPNHPELPTLQEQGARLRQAKDSLGLEDDEQHLNISKVAKEVGMAGLFYGINGFLSKLVHPTSFSLMLNLDHARELQLRQALFELGLGAAEDALQVLADNFESAGIDSTPLRAS